ncbi:MAG: CAP domain-containing protein, partial [Ilumatobacteraceae bacterium]
TMIVTPVAPGSPTRSPRTRQGAVVGVLLVIGMLLTACGSTDAATNASDIDRIRASVGVGQLTRVAELDTKAQAQADRMARRARIFHSTSLTTRISPGWNSVGENVASAGSIQQAQVALEASPAHYANLANSGYTEVGIGVANRNGVVYLVQIFVGR